MALTYEQAAQRAAHYGKITGQRDEMVIACLAAGLPISELARLTGLSRYTIYGIQDRAARKAPVNAPPRESPRIQPSPGAALSVPFRAAMLAEQPE